MRKVLKTLLFPLLLTLPVWGQTVSVSVNLKSMFGANQGTQTTACFSLVDSSGNQITDPRVVGGSGVIIPTSNQCLSPNGSGLVSTLLYANDQISPAGSLYSVQYTFQNRVVHGDTFNFLLADVNENLNIKAPINTVPLIPPPTGDSTYARLDGGNQPFLGPIQAPSANILGNETVGGTLTAGTFNAITNPGGSRFLADDPEGPYLLKVNPVLNVGAGGSGEDQVVGDMWVVKDPSGVFYGYYTMVAAGFIPSGIGQATSDDGQSWTKNPSNPIIPAPNNKATVVPNICGSAWCMYVLRNAGPDASINLFTASTQAGPWTAYVSNPVLSPGGSQQATEFLAVSAYIESGTLTLFYAASDSVDFVNRIFAATSTDGKTFTKQGKVADVGAGGQWDSGWRAPGSIIKTAEGKYVMSYNAGNGVPGLGNLEPGPQGIGFLHSTALYSGWTPYTANPVIQTDSGVRFESNTVWRGYLWQLGSKFLLSVDAGDTGSVERQFLAELTRTQPSSVGGINVPTFNSLQIKSIDGCLTLYNPLLGAPPNGQYRICSRGDTDAWSIFHCGATSTESVCANPVEQVRGPASASPFFPFGISAGNTIGSPGFSVFSNGQVGGVHNIAAVSDGVPHEVQKVDLLAQNNNIGATTFYSVPTTNGVGMYTIHAYTVITTAAGVSSTLPQINILYTDADSGQVVTLQVTSQQAANTLGTTGLFAGQYWGTATINVKATTNVQYSLTGYASNAANAMQYAVHIRLVQLGQ